MTAKNHIPAVLGLLFLAFIYINTACPTIYMGDSGEIVTAAITLGIAHPPGYPLTVLGAKVFSMIFPGDSAYAVNIFSIFLGLAVYALLYFFLIFFMNSLFKKNNDTIIRLCALLTAFSFSVSPLFWFEALDAKGGVYIMSLMLMLASVYGLMLLYYTRRTRFFYMTMYASGFLPAVHHTGILFMLFICVAAMYLFRRKSRKTLAKGTAFFLLPFITPHLYLFIRSSEDIAMKFADIEGFSMVLGHLLRKAYSTSQSAPLSAAAVWFKFSNYVLRFISDYTLLGAAAAAGMYAVYRENKKMFLISFIFLSADLGALILLTGNTMTEIDAYINRGFYLSVDLVFMIFAAAGIYFFVNILKQKAGIKRAFSAYVLFLLPLITLFTSYENNNHSAKFHAYDYPNNLMNMAGKGDIVFAEKDCPVFNLLYMKQIKGKYKGINIYDREASYLDLSVFDEVRDIMSQEAALSVERELFMKNQDKIYYTGIAEMKDINVKTIPYGYLYKMSREEQINPATEKYLETAVIRDYFRNKKLDLFYRDFIARQFTKKARYAVIKKDMRLFRKYAYIAEQYAGKSPEIMSSLAITAIFYLKNYGLGAEYAEKLVLLDKHNRKNLMNLIKIYMVVNPAKAVEWLKFYEKAASGEKEKKLIRRQIEMLRRAR